MGYCEISDVKKLMPPQIIKALNDPDKMEKPITDAEIAWYIDYAADMINSVIGQLYVVPIVKIIVVNKADGSETEMYPYPIKDINAMLTAAYIYKKLYSESQNPQELPKYSEDYQSQALKLLNQVVAGGINIKGQRMLGRRYLRPESMNVNRLPVEFKELDINK